MFNHLKFRDGIIVEHRWATRWSSFRCNIGIWTSFFCCWIAWNFSVVLFYFLLLSFFSFMLRLMLLWRSNQIFTVLSIEFFKKSFDFDIFCRPLTDYRSTLFSRSWRIIRMMSFLFLLFTLIFLRFVFTQLVRLLLFYHDFFAGISSLLFVNWWFSLLR